MIGISTADLAEKLGVESRGPSLEIVGVTSPHHPQSNKIIPLLDWGKKNTETMEVALEEGNCFFTTKEIYTQIQAKYPNHHSWVLTSTEEIKSIFIVLLAHFDTFHTPSPTVAVESDSDGRVIGSSQQALSNIGSYIAEDAFIGPQVVVGRDTRIEAGAIVLGQSYIGYGVTLGKDTLIHPQVTIHNGSVIGDRCIIHSGTVIGSDGFGYQPSSMGSQKVPQIGNVVIGDSVEIGSNCSLDRATLNSTQIGNRVKIDNLVQIGHNVTIGDDTIIVAQTGIGGSCDIGKRVTLGGQVGVADHVTIEDGVTIASKSGIYSGAHIPAGSTLNGIPAIDHIQHQRINVTMRQLVKKRGSNSPSNS